MSKLFMLLAVCMIISGCGYSGELENINKRYGDIDTNPNLVGYLTCVNRAGQVVFSGVVKGKITRADGENSGYYVYWFDQKNRYHQWNGEYFYTNYPLRLIVDPILIEIERGEK